MAIFYISDTHFSHTNILKFEAKARPFSSIEEHDEELIKRWNETVSPEDTIIHLGDVCFKPATAIDKIIPRLNGKKKLIMGNHDIAPTEKYSRYFEILPVLTMPKKGLIFTHYPIHPSQLEFRYKTNIHGHCHSHKIQLEEWTDTEVYDKRYVNISCEHTDLRPISQDELFKRVK